MPLPAKTEMAHERVQLDDLLDKLEEARLALKKFRKNSRVREARALRRSAKAFKKLLAGTRAEADLLMKTWISVVENGGEEKDGKK